MIVVKISILLLLLVILIRFKIHLSVAIMIDAVVMILMFSIEFEIIWKSVKFMFTDLKNINLLGAVIFITYLGTLLQAKDHFNRIFKNLSLLFGDIRYAVAIIPAFIGMVSMPGGALFSAPMVDEGGKQLKVSAALRQNLNFVFRHSWELFLPMYPAILLISNMFDISLKTIMTNQFGYSIVYVVIGYLVFLRPIKKVKPIESSVSKLKISKNIMKDIWPILAIILILLIFNLNIILTTIPVIIGFMLIKKISVKEMIHLFRKSFSISIVLTMFAIIFFQSLIEVSGVLNEFPIYLESHGVNPAWIAGLTPFIVGLLTGLTIASVGISFPLLKSLYLVGGVFNYPMLMLSLTMGFMGVMISPMHLCLTLTKDYYKTTYKDIFRKLFPFVLMLIVVYVVFYLLGLPPQF